METRTIRWLKFIYLVMFVTALGTACAHGFYSALDVFFREPFPVPWNALNEIFYAAWPIVRFTYVYCFIASFPMLALIHRCEVACTGENAGDARRASRMYVVVMVAWNACAVLLAVVLLLVVDPFFAGQAGTPLLWIWEIVAIVVFIAFAVNLPRLAGTVNDDIQEFHVRGYHVHESIFGVFFIFTGILFLFNVHNTVDLIFAAFFFVAGGFLFGRDVKDVMAGKFIEKVDKGSPAEKKERRLF